MSSPDAITKPHIHVVTFQNPWPPDYGGAIDVYYKLKSLNARGWRVTLHCHVYGDRQDAGPLRRVADKVIAYRRETGMKAQLSLLPYIVNSRRNPRLIADLCGDNDPILFEGLHTCHPLDHPYLKGRIKIVRAHNVEHDYYRGLARNASGWSKKVYYSLEAWRLRRYERILGHADAIAAVSAGDAAHFTELFPDKKVILMPCFFDEDARSVAQKTLTHAPCVLNDSQTGGDILPGYGRFVLYHGDLSVEENIGAVRFIADEIAARLSSVRFVIAGRNPSSEIIKYCGCHPNIEVAASPSPEEMAGLMNSARVSLLLTFQPTGLKLKLLNAIERSAHIVVNRAMLAGSGLDACVTVADSPEEIASAISRLLDTPFTGRAAMPEIYRNAFKITLLEEVIGSLQK